MAILKYDTRFGTIGGKITSQNSANLVFQVEGQAFLQWEYDPNDPTSEPSPTKGNGYLYFVSTTQNSAIINYGDGTITTYNFHEHGGLYYLAFSSQIGSTPNSAITNFNPQENHLFTDSSTARRGVLVKITNPASITGIVSSAVWFWDELPQEIASLSNIGRLSFSFLRKLNSFPFEWSLLKKINTLYLNQISPDLLIEFPAGFANFPVLKTLTISNCFDFSDPEASSMDRIGNYGASLESLDIRGCNVKTMPDNFSSLTGLTYLSCGTLGNDGFAEPPVQINSMTSLKTLFFGYHSTVLNSWGDLSNLVNLENVTLHQCSLIPAEIPSWFANATKLKQLYLPSCFNTQDRIDDFVDSLYAFVIANAPITGTVIDQYRSMTIILYRPEVTPIQSVVPTGTYQQPSGYVQGSSNGSPESQYEKVWVLVNQYDHVWTLPPL